MRKLALLAFFLSSVLFADGQPFSVDSTSPTGDSPDAQMNTVAGMKYRAVVEWLQRYLGNRYAQVEKQVTPEFAERYILDYKVGRVPTNRALLQVTGHLDADSLKRWARVNESKDGGNTTVKGVFIMSSSVPGTEPIPGALYQTAFAMASGGFTKFNGKLTMGDAKSTALSQPPRGDSETRALRDALKGSNTVVWMTLAPCNKMCTGLRLNTYVYNLPHARLALVRSDDLALAVGDLTNNDRVHNALKGSARQFAQEVDEAVSGGTLFSRAHRVLVEGVGSYRQFQDLELELPKADYVTQAVLKSSAAQQAEFEVLTTLSAEELYNRLSAEDFPGFKLKPVRVDPSALVVRYSK